jgi:hypothetical protein
MGIAILLEDEHGDVLETIEWPTWLDSLLPSYDDESFQCLRFVDPYGDTIFNVVQMPTLLRDRTPRSDRRLRCAARSAW